ncbi:CheR family methyltransferase [Glaciecola siphonariae]|uniref:protein-glutamate O-methyltransferase n=1 Tax=Glaciecola siphonariae TaxID=521012 RepID=A0ABV9LTW5_9ALTE
MTVAPTPALNDVSYGQFARFLAQRLGITLGENKQYLVSSRLSMVMREFDALDINEFIARAIDGKNTSLTERALESMTTNETFWFRDEYPYQILANDLLPAIAKTTQKLRIWSSACSYGQEPYSIAMVISEFKRRQPSAFSAGVEIIASDISQKVLKFASDGIYDELAIARGLPTAMQDRYFSRVDKSKLKVNESIKSMVSFKRVNLLDSFYALGKFDIIFCRNVLIYFDADNKASILQKLAALLPADGAVMLGAAESVSGAEDVLKMEKCARGLYYRRRA